MRRTTTTTTTMTMIGGEDRRKEERKREREREEGAGDVAAAVSIADVQDCPFFPLLFPLPPFLPFDRGFAISIVYDSTLSLRAISRKL